MSDLYYIIVLFVLGLFFGSFYNVVGLRSSEDKSIMFPPSHCPKCNNRLKWYELIPVLSYIFLGGKCKNCKKSISPIYPIIELLTGITFAISFIVFGYTLELLFALTFLSILIIIIVSDVKYMIIPDEVIMIGLPLIIGVSLFTNGVYDTAISALSGIGTFGIMYIIKFLGDKGFKKETMGGGDIKLMLLIGFVLGMPLGVISIFLASFFAFPIAILILLIKKTNALAFGPFLAIASAILYLTQTDISKIIELLS